MYKLPLTGDYTELKVGLGAVTQLALGQEDAFLYVATTDGTISVFDLPADASRALPRRCASHSRCLALHKLCPY